VLAIKEMLKILPDRLGCKGRIRIGKSKWWTPDKFWLEAGRVMLQCAVAGFLVEL
jgi:hypothetical protein